jgi:hypothetical protein
LDFLALIEIEIKVAEFEPFFSAARGANIKADTLQRCEIRSNANAGAWRIAKRNYAICHGVVSSLCLGDAIQVNRGSLIHGILHSFLETTEVANDLE